MDVREASTEALQEELAKFRKKRIHYQKKIEKVTQKDAVKLKKYIAKLSVEDLREFIEGLMVNEYEGLTVQEALYRVGGKEDDDPEWHKLTGEEYKIGYYIHRLEDELSERERIAKNTSPTLKALSK